VNDTATPTQAMRQTVIDAILAIAPEADFTQLDAGKSLRQQLDIDSFDFLNLLIDLHARLGVEIPEADYGKVDALDSLVAYLAARKSSG
jgi:acyl carrier protein